MGQRRHPEEEAGRRKLRAQKLTQRRQWLRASFTRRFYLGQTSWHAPSREPCGALKLKQPRPLTWALSRSARIQVALNGCWSPSAPKERKNPPKRHKEFGAKATSPPIRFFPI
jgi:hypothetical protein